MECPRRLHYDGWLEDDLVGMGWHKLHARFPPSHPLAGSATRLESQFRLTYSMILNLLRVEDLKVG